MQKKYAKFLNKKSGIELANQLIHHTQQQAEESELPVILFFTTNKEAIRLTSDWQLRNNEDNCDCDIWNNCQILTEEEAKQQGKKFTYNRALLTDTVIIPPYDEASHIVSAIQCLKTYNEQNSRHIFYDLYCVSFWFSEAAACKYLSQLIRQDKL